jgi:hypothetical protein
MSRRTLILLAASVIVGSASVATVSTDAFASRKGAQHRVATVPPAAIAVGIVTNPGPVADRVPRCFDSVVLYPYPPCY